MKRMMCGAIVAATLWAAAGARGEDLVYTAPDGTIRVHPVKVGEEFQNQGWTPAMEDAFWKRAQVVINLARGSKEARTGGEGEKWAYPTQMLNYLAGEKSFALGVLQAGDGEAGTDNKHTLGIDWYWSFTIKGQIRKYFLFGDLLEPAYKKQMYEAAKIWTAEDPRPNFELVLLLDNSNEQIRAYALAALQKSKKQLEDSMAGDVGEKLREWAKKAPANRAEAIKVIDELAAKYKGQDFGSDIATWRAWWKEFADHDWMVLEEAERVMNIKPHPLYGRGRPGAIGDDFSPAARGYWVDGRNTDNLRAMRETSVYLMSEETGNELTRLIYKEKIKRFVTTSYRIGMGEWDSENYLSHTTMPYHNLYDFAKDPEVKLLAKAFLDWVYTANAVKYYRGGFGGPTKRDYGGASRVFGSEPAVLQWVWSDDCPLNPKDLREDIVHAITTAYRPPAAVVALARKDFKKPVELLDTKPTYSNWFPGADAEPEFFETMFYGNTYYLGTVVSKAASHDVGPFKLLATNTSRGVDYFLANSGNKMNSKNERDQFGQYRNLCVCLNGDKKAFGFQAPDTAKIGAEDGIWFVELEKTYLAVRPIGLAMPTKGGKAGKEAGDSMYAAKPDGAGYTGYALEVGEADSYKSMDAFKAAVKSKSKLDLTGLAAGKVTLTGVDGRVLAYAYNAQNDLPTVVRDGKARDWTKKLDMYKPAAGDGPVKLGWKEGTLRVEAGGQIFTETVTPEGKVTFKFE